MRSGNKASFRLGLGLALFALSTLTGCGAESEEGSSDDEVQAGRLTASAEDFDKYAAFATSKGLDPSKGTVVIGIRGRDTTSKLHPTRVMKAFDDTLVVLTKKKEAFILPVSTHPWETKSSIASGVPDVDSDGAADVGMIRPGKYVATQRDAKRNIAHFGTYAVATAAGAERLPGYRNTNHDDTYSPDERTASEGRKDGLTDVLFHFGLQGAPPAVGCQVLDTIGIQELLEKAGSRFDYLLVDANEEEVP